MTFAPNSSTPSTALVTEISALAAFSTSAASVPVNTRSIWSNRSRPWRARRHDKCSAKVAKNPSGPVVALACSSKEEVCSVMIQRLTRLDLGGISLQI